MINVVNNFLKIQKGLEYLLKLINSIRSTNSNSADTVTQVETQLTTESDPVFGASAAASITSTNISNWNAKYAKPSTGISKDDLSSSVQNSLDKADTAVQYDEFIVKDSGITDTEITVEGNTIYTTSNIYDIYPGEKIKYICTTTNHATYLINAGVTPKTLLQSSDYGEVNYVNNTDDVIQVQGGCISNNDEFIIEITRLGLIGYENLFNKVTSLSSPKTHIQYPSAKAVYDELVLRQKRLFIVNKSGTSLIANINNYYIFEDAVNTLAITFPVVTDVLYTNVVVITFTTGSNPNVTFAASGTGINVIAQDGFSIEANSRYEINALFNGVNWIITAMKLSTTPINS